MSTVTIRDRRRVLGALSRVLDGVTTVFLVVSIGCLAGIMLLLTVDVLLRNAFNYPLPITIPYVEILMAGTVAGAITYTQRLDGHIAADVVTSRLPERVARWVTRVGMLVAIAALMTIAYTTTTTAIASLLERERRQGLVPVEMWPARMLVAAAFIVLALLVVRHVYREFTSPARAPEGSEG